MNGNVLIEFYHSKEWQKLLQIIRMERIQNDESIICEHCGKPIIKAYDCIGHHTIELTEQNVNDAEISLNPALIKLVHHRCHNKIHNKLGYKNKQVYLVYGSPLSGKTTYVNDNAEHGDLVVDIDNIYKCITVCSRYEKPGRVRNNVFQMRDLLIDMIRTRNGKWLNAYVVGGYPLISERERLAKMLGAREIFIDTKKEECLKRLYENPDGRDISEWEKYISDWFDKFSPSVSPPL